MYQVSRQIDFCYGHRLLNYSGKCRYVHGHTDRPVITIEFSDIKRVVSTWIDEELDHRMLLHKDDPALPFLRELGEPLHVLDVNPTAENIAKLIHEFTVAQGFPIIETQLWETPRCYATYRG